MTCVNTTADTASHPHASAADKALQQSLPPTEPSSWWRSARVWDVLALIVIALVIWKLLIAPRSLRQAGSQPAPHITLAALQGPKFALTAHRGHVVFLDFYATWCEPCKISLPLVERFAKSHPKVDVVPIDVGEPRFVAAEFAKAYHLQNVALDEEKLAANWFGVDGFPTMVVIDPAGNVRATWAGLNPAIQLNMASAESQLSGT